MSELNGNTTGIRDSLLAEIRKLYDWSCGRDEFVPVDLACAMAGYSARINREIAVYISRNGIICDVTIGSLDHVPLGEHRLRRGEERLAGVRCIHTHPGGTGELSDVDISALKSLWLDGMCAVGCGADGRVNTVGAAFLGEKKQGMPQPVLTPLYALEEVPQQSWMEQVTLSDRLVQQGEERQSAARERAMLVSTDSEQSLEELAALCDSAGLEVAGRTLQRKSRPDPATYIGSGKAEELALDAQALEADVIVVDDELTGAQNSRLEEIVGLKVIDRTALILDIFAQRAKTSEGKLQVELAQLQYRATHLIGKGMAMSRLAGGVGTRGPGETKLEMDRRYIRERINVLQKDLAQLKEQRAVRRKNRQKNETPVVALVGYTNAGKSTLLNRLSGSDVYAEDQLFATLDAVSRQVALEDGGTFILVDSVGFISKLPMELIEAFQSTLEEAVLADVLVIVSDGASPQMAAQHQVVEQVLEKLGATSQARIEAVNKADVAAADDFPAFASAIRISAKTGAGLDELLAAIARTLRERQSEYTAFVPFSHYAQLAELRRHARILQEQHEEDGTRLRLQMDAATAARLAKHQGIAIVREAP